MTIEIQVAALTTATTNLLAAVNVSKATLDAGTNTAVAQANNAANSAAAANTSAGASSGSAAQALAIYGTTLAQQAAVTAAANSASVASGHAASAASVMQQDLSGVTAAALHRSPNAVTALFIYDTSKDSDPTWPKRMAGKSWMTEPLNGKWLGWAVSEAAARAVSGAATGDYFGRTSDGKCYSLNASTGITETFRGNKPEFPALSAIVGEAASVTIYDLTQPGFPIWMRFVTGLSPVGGIYVVNGVICVACGGAFGLRRVSFPDDRLTINQAGGQTSATATISGRNVTGFTGPPADTSKQIVNSNVNAVSATILPDAIFDPVTAMQSVLTAAFTAGGVSIIKPDGTVVKSASTAAAIKGYVDKDIVVWSTATGVLGARNPGTLTANFVATAYTTTTSPALLGLPTVIV